MKKLLAIVVLGTVLTTPPFAQRDPNDSNVHQRAGSAQQRSTVPPGGIYYGRNNKLNPDFQLGR